MLLFYAYVRACSVMLYCVTSYYFLRRIILCTACDVMLCCVTSYYVMLRLVMLCKIVLRLTIYVYVTSCEVMLYCVTSDYLCLYYGL